MLWLIGIRTRHLYGICRNAMPFCLYERDVSAEVAGKRTALLVPCGFCPAVSFAVRTERPYLDLLRHGVRTAPYEEHIQTLTAELEGRGLKVRRFDWWSPHQFVVCMWTVARRRQLAELAAGYDLVVVLGCDAARKMIEDCLPVGGATVVQAMRMEGLMDVVPLLEFPCRLSLKMGAVTRVLDAPKSELRSGSETRPSADVPNL